MHRLVIKTRVPSRRLALVLLISFHTKPAEQLLFSPLNQIESRPPPLSVSVSVRFGDTRVLFSKRFHLSLSRVSRNGSFFWEGHFIWVSAFEKQQPLSGFLQQQQQQHQEPGAPLTSDLKPSHFHLIFSSLRRNIHRNMAPIKVI